MADPGARSPLRVSERQPVHDPWQPFYPAVCRGFPWTDAETGGPYEYDQTICPEFVARPELVQLRKA